MKTVRSIRQLREQIKRAKHQGKSIGFVPTMGAFHEGHLALMRKARAETDRVVVSIFVNPIQFNQKADLETYPRSLRRDSRLAAQAGCDLLFIPKAQTIYPPDFQTAVEVTTLSRLWEGKCRPGHFKGVTTVVTKLFHLVEPDRVYFGQKDAQQAKIVEQLIRDLNFNICLRVLPTVRERDGLAMSSRNARLSSVARRSSSTLFAALQSGCRLIECGECRAAIVGRRVRNTLRQKPGIRVEYVAVVNPKTLQPVRSIRGAVWILVAVWVGRVRLIDGCVARKQ